MIDALAIGKSEKPFLSNTSSRGPASTDTQTLKEAQNKYKLLENDYRTLHEKRLQDVS